MVDGFWPGVVDGLVAFYYYCGLAVFLPNWIDGTRFGSRLLSTAAITSASKILPSGPVPLTSLILRLCFLINPRTNGVANCCYEDEVEPLFDKVVAGTSSISVGLAAVVV